MSASSSHLRVEARADEVRRIVFELAGRRARGEVVSEESLVVERPDLMPELAQELAKLRSIEHVLEEADDTRYREAMRRIAAESDGSAGRPCDGRLNDLLGPRGALDAEQLSSDTSWDGCGGTPGGELPARIGRYRIRHLLGEGTFGRVYLAWDEALGREVAIKMPHPQQLDEPRRIEEYLAEARNVARLDHASILPVYDVGQTEEGCCYVVSKWIRGSDLQLRMGRGRIPRAEAVRIITTVADALDHAHGHGLVHRDVKPANILLDARGAPYIGDFGLALRGMRTAGGHSFAGTPAYMSPEQARGEAHRVDARSDVFSLGVVLYELLTGAKPFQADSYEGLLEQVVSADPIPPEQRDPSIAAELARICLKALSKRAADRYPTARAMADDLRHYLDLAARQRLLQGVFRPGDGLLVLTRDASEPPPRKIIPRGLRPFEASDCESFLSLVPGPRDRDGLPESIRQWKARIDQQDHEQSFAVGVLYGPSGSGKSSLVRAGLLPRLSAHVHALYVEAAPEHTEDRLLRRLLERYPELPREGNLADALAALRCGCGPAEGAKLLVVIDQFEQWLHGRGLAERRTLVEALRQCDGGRVQCLLLVRDDFWLALSRFMSEVEIDLVERRNVALVDLFDPAHAHHVLAEFGRAFGQLPEDLGQMSAPQRAFLERAIEGLTHEDKIVPVRLALFAEMVKAKPWVPATLRDVGGPDGLGVAFLEETFRARTANPRYRAHEQAARAVLEALLPEVGSDIKGRLRSYPELLDISGYGTKPRAFKELVRILDSETRLITPTDPRVAGREEETFLPVQRYYQLTHDYLVASLRQWLTKRSKSTRAGRSELRLASRSMMWTAHPERRQLPSLWEWISIRLLTRSDRWSESQRKMMRTAARHHALSLTLGAVLLLVLLLAGSGLGQMGRQLLTQVRAHSAAVWMAVGYDRAVWPLLEGGPDPTLRTQVVHTLKPVAVDLETIFDRMDQQDEVSIRRAMLLVAGDHFAEPSRQVDTRESPQRVAVFQAAAARLLEYYRSDPDPGIHAAAEWALRAHGQRDAIALAAGQLVSEGTRGDRQWYINSQGHTMMIIAGPAQFLMGSAALPQSPDRYPRPHLQRIRRSFSIASTETTAEQFQKFLATSPWVQRASEDRLPLSLENPQNRVSWYEAAAYCNWLSKTENLPPDEWCYQPNGEGAYAAGMHLAPDYLNRRGYRLPTEAEWEYACRAGTTTAYHFGNDPSYLEHYSMSAAVPRVVATGRPNDFGLFDMHGNVAEWCQDRYDVDPTGENTVSTGESDRDLTVGDADARVLRGGAFSDPVHRLRSAARTSARPAQRQESIGFRVARSYP